MNKGNIFVDELPGHLRIRVEGEDPTHPWQIVLPVEAAFHLANELFRKAVQAGGTFPTQATTQSGAAPARRPPALRSGNGRMGGPQSSADGLPQQSPGGQSQPTSAPPDDLLGDDFQT